MNIRSTLKIITLLILSSCSAQSQNSRSTAGYSIAFYNVENLFDTIDDPDTYDEDFTPKGSYRYTEKVYHEKLNNIATVINKLNNDAPAIVGLAEIENNDVLRELVNISILKDYNYKYISYNSPDPRGIDNALIYRADKFKVLNSRAIKVEYLSIHTRDVLYVTGVLGSDTLHILVNHWPSRREGLKQSAPKRAAAARTNRMIVDSLLKQNSESNIIIMGDMNDNPDDESIANVLQANDNKQNQFYNPWLNIYRLGKGTSVYHRNWDLFDQIIISRGLLDNNGIQFQDAEIFDADFIRNDYRGEDAYPKRSFKGKQWNQGYSDHLPIIIHLN